MIKIWRANGTSRMCTYCASDLTQIGWWWHDRISISILSVYLCYNFNNLMDKSKFLFYAQSCLARSRTAFSWAVIDVTEQCPMFWTSTYIVTLPHI